MVFVVCCAIDSVMVCLMRVRGLIALQGFIVF